MQEAPKFPESGIVYTHSETHLSLVNVVGIAEHCWDGDSMLRVVSVPTRQMQTEYVHGEGPGIMSRRNILREATPNEAYYYLRAQILLERIAPKFPQIKRFVSIPPRLVLLCEHLTGQKRREICGQIIGAYPRYDVYFAASHKLDAESLTTAQKAILSQALPQEWEIAQSSDLNWSTSFPKFEKGNQL